MSDPVVTSKSPPSESEGWGLAVTLVAEWQQGKGRADHLLEDHAAEAAGRARGHAQGLFFGAIRHWRRIDSALRPLLERPPRPQLMALLTVACGELIENPTVAPPLIVDHAVRAAKRLVSVAESRFVNAVMRRVVPALRDVPPPGAATPSAEQAAFFSHPDWLVEKWIRQFGREETHRLLEWNQTPAAVHVRWRAGEAARPTSLEPTPWAGFFRLNHGAWAGLLPAIAAGQCYLQDPATRLAAEMVAPVAGETVLDLCAAPGGKTLQLADAMGTGTIVAVDRPTGRLRRFEENLTRWHAAGGQAKISLVAGDVDRLTAEILSTRGLPTTFDAVLLDAPCSNTGVLRHRVDAKWRLEPGEFDWLGEVQGKLLARAAQFVRPGGRLIYSTCSLEPEENEEVVADFLASPAGAGFVLETSLLARPWQHGHDGAGVFRLRRSG
jgi:16S rRNA (cytosine967-C5)-methyltransferase